MSFRSATRRLVRLGLVTGAVWGLLAGQAAPAHAHGRGSDATNYSSRITSEPSLEGVTWAVHGGDELLELRNESATEVVVLGYEGEPYLRVGPEGVLVNRNSPASYLNDERFRTQLPPGVRVDPEAPPEWERISDGTAHNWHDHRIHWMAPTPAVADGSRTQLIFEWSVPFVVDGEEHGLRGELLWIPGPPVWLWLLAGLALVAPAVAGVRTAPSTDPVRWPGLARPAAVVLGVVVVLNVSHLVDDFLAVPLPAGVVLFAAFQTAVFLAMGVFGCVRGWQAGDASFTALGVGAGALFIGQGLLYIPALGASQLATVFPDWLARLTVAASLMVILPLGVVAYLGTKALMPAAPDAAPDAGPDAGPDAARWA